MLQAKAQLHDEPERQPSLKSVMETTIRPVPAPPPSDSLELAAPSPPVKLPQRKANQPLFPGPRPADGRDLQTRVPVILGEVTYRGTLPVDGIICGQPGVNGGALTVRQRGRTYFGSEPELNGEIRFVDMLRVNGHIAGSVYSKKGTIIVDATAVIDADVEVAIAIVNGTVNGDIVAHQRVEVAPTAKIYGNIWTRSLAIQSGAIFEGVCQMLEGKDDKS
jgi:cytoskeletal protein CcmA (bactofilin family)